MLTPWYMWLFMVFLITFVIGVITYVNKKGWGQWDLVDKDTKALTESYFLPAWGLFVMRLVIFAFSFSVMVYNLAEFKEWNFTFYTVWNYTILITTFFLLTLESGFYLHNARLPKFIGRAAWILFEIECANVILVDLVVWTVLYEAAGGGNAFVDFTSLNVHAANFFLMMAELGMNRITIVRSHMCFLFTLVTIYALITWIRMNTGSLQEWPYFFMDTSAKAAIAWYIGLFIVHVLFYMAVYGLYVLKMKFVNWREAVNGSVQDTGEDQPLVAESSGLSYQDNQA
eukprot:m.158146 g.158146  ORF g.158146 m.158146 type:complete len:285 (+) comp15127_c1_seq2:110-964(+)